MSAKGGARACGSSAATAVAPEAIANINNRMTDFMQSFRGCVKDESSGVACHERVIFRMRSDPEPDHRVRVINRERAIMQADTNGPDGADLFEMQRWMPRILT